MSYETYEVLFYDDGTKCWYLNGKRHRIDGPAIEFANDGKEWFVDGKRHRIDGPAVERADGAKYWYIDGKQHRIDGPAIEHANGDKEWWLNGINMTKEESGKRINQQQLSDPGVKDKNWESKIKISRFSDLDLREPH